MLTDILAFIILFFIISLLVISCILAFIYDDIREKRKNDYLLSLSEHERDLIRAYEHVKRVPIKDIFKKEVKQNEDK